MPKLDPQVCAAVVLKHYGIEYASLSPWHKKAIGKRFKKLAMAVSDLLGKKPKEKPAKLKAKHSGSKQVWAEEMRQNPTAAEKALRTALRSNFINPDECENQKVLGNYILDFYIDSAKLCIEADGGYHLTPEQKKKDALRTKWLNAYGIKVLRFSNDKILANPMAVADEVLAECEKRIEATISREDEWSGKSYLVVPASAAKHRVNA